MKDLISIIVPVYNSALYIRECAASVLAQSYAYWELIFIDDGSQDSTKELCEYLCKQDKRIRLLCQEHRGVSAARNVGIEAAGGKYLFFLDSDDAIHPALLETLYRLMKESQAAVGTETLRYIKNDRFSKVSNRASDKKNAKKGIYLRNDEAVNAFASEISLNVIGGKMVRCDALKAVKFNEKLSNGEDTLFIYQMLITGADVIILPNGWYYYRRHEKSASASHSLLSIQSRYIVIQYIRDFEKKNNRMANAVRYEEIMLDLIVQWYVKCRHSQSKEIKEYMRTLVESEKKESLFFKVGWHTRLQVFLSFSCYPLYWIIHIFL